MDFLRTPVSRHLPLVLFAAFTLSACSKDDGGYADDGGYSTGGDEGLSGDSGGAGEGSGEGGETGGTPAGQLTAAEWSDLDNWDFWLSLADSQEWAFQLFEWGIDTSVRVPVRVVAGADPVVDAEVVLTDANQSELWRARTDNEGDAELWPSVFGQAAEYPLSVTVGGEVLEIAEPRQAVSDDPFVVSLDEAPAVTGLDLMFVIDTTSSMSDELSYLQAELADVIARVESDLGQDASLRVSVNFYRDTTDEYVVRPFPFTDASEAISQLQDQTTDGGGDYEEAVEVALADAVTHEWRDSARARLLFLVLDAPPHDTQEIRASLEDSVTAFATMGVRVIPLGASGINKDTEFLLRNIDIATGATYTFLTDDSGIGNEHLEPTIGDYEVELLNDLMVRLIVASMA